MSAVVEVSSVTLDYRLVKDRPASLKEYAVASAKRKIRHETLRALDGVSFTVVRGEVLAVIGHNGAGKSTLMKVLSRVLPPTRGRVVVRGRIAPMIELGAGFNTELTAAENIIMYGTLLGRDPKEMRSRIEPIVKWAGLEEFVSSPLRSFSTGMIARLGFAIATDVVPDVLIVDEVLSVGDEAFQRKSKQRLESLMSGGASVVLVSHNLETVKALAARALWLDHGRLAMEGPAERVVTAYKRSS